MPRIHQHGSDRILIFDTASEPILIPDEGANVICRFGNGFGVFWMDGQETLLLSGASALPTVEAALENVIGQLDDLNSRREEFEREAEARALAQLAPPQPEEKIFWNTARHDVSIPLEVMLRLLNALPPDSPIRDEALKSLPRERNGAIPHGIVRTPTGELAFDKQRYSVAVYRRKQARYAASLIEELGKVARGIESVNSLLDDECQAESVPGLAIAGDPLAEMPARAVDVLEAVERALKPALVDVSAVHRRITNSN